MRGGGGGLKAGPGRRVRREKGGPAAVRGGLSGRCGGTLQGLRRGRCME